MRALHPVRVKRTAVDPEVLAHAIAGGLERPAPCRDVEADGAGCAAELIARIVRAGMPDSSGEGGWPWRSR